jgi:tetratricopeptide (TPR) repeat protein
MMSVYTPTTDEAYRQYAELLVKHHQLLSENKNEDTETELVEDEMSSLWESFDSLQKQSLSGLGSDLNWARRGCQGALHGRKPEDVTRQDFQTLVELREKDDWHGVLHYLRLCAPCMRPFQLADLRATAWSAIHLPKVVTVFYDVAAELEPSNGPIALLALRAAEEADPVVALEKARRITEDEYRYTAVVVTLATAMQLREFEGKGIPYGRQLFAELLHSSVRRLRLERTTDAEAAMTYQLAATGFESLDEPQEALKCYEEGLKKAPDKETLLVGLGLLLYGRDDDRAAIAFSRAAQLDSPLVWPYFFLSHFHLLRHQFKESLRFSMVALPIAATNPVRAELLEWIAICQSELAYGDEAVRTLFREATALDPANERIARNFRFFETARHGVSQLRFDIEPAASLKVRRAPEARPSLARVAA